ncbi:hypothetical protein EBT25_11645 [bacterium]|nr:hypothetical protein [bacterium]
MNSCIPNGWPPAYGCGGGSSTTPVTLAYGPQIDAFGRLRVSQPYTLYDSQQRYDLDHTFVSNVSSGGNVTFVATQSTANLQVTSTVGSYAARESQYVFVYQPGKSLLALVTFVMAPLSDSSLRQRVGYFGKENGYFLELKDQVYIVERSNVTGTVTETYVPQSSWNTDQLNGYGTSGVTLDITKAQIFWIDMEWLGVGNVRSGFVYNGQFVVAHVFQHANYLKTAYITTATLPIRYEIETLAAGAPATSNLLQICSTVQSEGGYDQPYLLFSNITNFSSTMTAGVWYPTVSIRLAPGRLDAIAQIRQIDVVVTSADTIHWALWANVTATSLTGENFVAHASSPNVQIDRSATAFNTTGCQQVAAGLVSGTNQSAASSVLELTKYYSQIGRNSFTQTSDIMTLAYYSVTTISGTPATIQGLISWNELI